MGKGGPRNAEAAADCFEQAAMQGSADGRCLLGLCYLNGIGVEKDVKRTVQLCRLAAEADYRPAYYTMGELYEQGTGVKKDLQQAAQCYRWAAMSGLPMAQFAVGRCYEKGVGVEKDQAEADRWYSAAGEAGHLGAQVTMGLRCELGLCTKQENIDRDVMAVLWYRRAALQWFRQAALQNLSEARYRMGLYAEKGWGGEPCNRVVAKVMYRMAAEQGNAEARKALERLERRWF